MEHRNGIEMDIGHKLTMLLASSIMIIDLDLFLLLLRSHEASKWGTWGIKNKILGPLVKNCTEYKCLDDSLS